jgi:hypothetical protein
LEPLGQQPVFLVEEAALVLPLEPLRLELAEAQEERARFLQLQAFHMVVAVVEVQQTLAILLLVALGAVVGEDRQQVKLMVVLEAQILVVVVVAVVPMLLEVLEDLEW